MKKSFVRTVALIGALQCSMLLSAQAEVTPIDNLIAGGRPSMSRQNKVTDSKPASKKNMQLDVKKYKQIGKRKHHRAITSEDLLPPQDGKFKFRNGMQLQEVLAKANAGDVASMNELGLYYFSKKNSDSAVFWLTKASEKGNSNARNTLGAMYENGAGVPQNPVKAKACYESSTSVGDVVGSVLLGALLIRPVFTSVYDPYRACDIFRRGAECGWRDCEFYYGACCEYGWGCARDLEAAAYWYDRGYWDGCDDSAVFLGRMYRDGIGVPQDYEVAREIFEDAAKYDNPLAEYEIGRMYYSGYGVEKDISKGLEYLHEAKSHDLDIADDLLKDISKGHTDTSSWFSPKEYDADTLFKEVDDWDDHKEKPLYERIEEHEVHDAHHEGFNPFDDHDGSSVHESDHDSDEHSVIDHNPFEGGSSDHESDEHSVIEHNPFEGGSSDHDSDEPPVIEHNPFEGGSSGHDSGSSIFDGGGVHSGSSESDDDDEGEPWLFE